MAFERSSSFLYLQEVQWLPSQDHIPRWTERGILHGFTGRASDRPSQTIALDQIHSATIIEVPAVVQGRLEPGDGLISQTRGQIVGVKTADCLPILIVNPRGVMALHAGWKGLAGDILGEALRWMQRNHWSWAETEIALGPCISLDAFEVGPELIDAFQKGPFQMNDFELALASSKGQGDRWHLDLSTAALLQMARFKIPPEKITIVRTCTKREKETWHSFRRDGAHAGRNWSWVQLGP